MDDINISVSSQESTSAPPAEVNGSANATSAPELRTDIVGLVDRLIQLAVDSGNVECRLNGPQELSVISCGKPYEVVRVEGAKTMLRLLCSRVGVVCRERAGGHISLFGGEAEFDAPMNAQKSVRLTVRFANMPDQSWFSIDARPHDSRNSA